MEDQQKEIEIKIEDIRLPGSLFLPKRTNSLVLFAHGSGSSRFSPRNRFVAEHLNQSGIGTLLFDLLEVDEENRANLFDIPFLAKRLILATEWVRKQGFGRHLRFGYFGASTGAAAALWAAAELGSEVQAIVSRGGRPDLAQPRLQEVSAPTLLIVGANDHPVIPLNQQAAKNLTQAEVKTIIIPGATHLFEEPGTLEQVADYAASWFEKHLFQQSQKSA